MKTRLLVCCFSLFVFILGKAAVEVEREIINIKGSEDENTRPRSLFIIPVRAYLENTAIILEFTCPCESVTIQIINTGNGYSSYYNVIENPDNFRIDLIGEENGYYSLELIVDGNSYSGEFSLE